MGHGFGGPVDLYHGTWYSRKNATPQDRDKTNESCVRATADGLPMPSSGFKSLTPANAIERLGANDQTLSVCDLSSNAVLQKRGHELIPKLTGALETNTECRELVLSDCGINDGLCSQLAAMLAKNETIVHLNLEGNKIGNDGAMSLARALSTNRA